MSNPAPAIPTLNSSRKKSKSLSSIHRIHDAVADLADETELCATFVPKGIPVQLFYENFCLVRGFTSDGRCQEITHLLEQIPHHLAENDFLLSSTSGDFDLCGQLWLAPKTLESINYMRRRRGQRPYITPEDAIEQEIRGDTKNQDVRTALAFSPTWSYCFIGKSVFATYDDFLAVMQSDFPVPSRKLLTVRLIDNIIPFYETTAGYDDEVLGMLDAPKIDKLLVFRNDLGDVVRSIEGHSDKLVAEIKLAPETSIAAAIDLVYIEPDRHGQIRPFVQFEEIDRITDEPMVVGLPSLDSLHSRNYEPGDVVDVGFVGRTPVLRSIIRKTTTPEPSESFRWVEAGECPSCRDQLVRKNGILYCENPWCYTASFMRLCYACSPNVLSVPLEKTELEFISIHAHYPLTLPSFLTLSKEEFNTTLSNDDTNYVFEVLRNRHNQLHGVDCAPEVQQIAQSKFLDALSLRGLYGKNIKRLQQHLTRRDFAWTDLTGVLTQPATLTRFGISPQDVRCIVEHAVQRKEEIQACAEL